MKKLKTKNTMHLIPNEGLNKLSYYRIEYCVNKNNPIHFGILYTTFPEEDHNIIHGHIFSGSSDEMPSQAQFCPYIKVLGKIDDTIDSKGKTLAYNISEIEKN